MSEREDVVIVIGISIEEYAVMMDVVNLWKVDDGDDVVNILERATHNMIYHYFENQYWKKKNNYINNMC